MIRNKFAMFDFTSTVPSLYVYGENRYKTFLGSLLTLMVFISVSVLSGFFLISFFERRDVNIVFFKESRNFTKEFSIPYFMFKFADVNRQPIDTRLAEMVVTQWVYNNSKTSTVNYLTYEQCSEQKHFKSYENKTKSFKFNVSDYDCMNIDDLHMSQYDSYNNMYYNIYIRECINSTLNNNSCYPREVIQQELRNKNMWIYYAFPHFIVDHLNTTNPIIESYIGNNRPVSYDMFYRDFIYFKGIKYTYDDGIVLEELRTVEGYAYDDVYTSRDVYPVGRKVLIPLTFRLFSFGINGDYVDYYKRTYPKLQSVLANIGGMLKLITFIAQILATYISTRQMFVDLSNEIIYYDKPFPNINTNKTINTTVNNNTITPRKLNVMYSNFMQRPRKTITTLEAILPRLFLKSPTKGMIDDFITIIKKRLSIDFILREINDLDKLRMTLLDNKNYTRYSNLKNMNVEEHLTRLRETSYIMKYKSIVNNDFDLSKSASKTGMVPNTQNL